MKNQQKRIMKNAGKSGKLEKSKQLKEKWTEKGRIGLKGEW